MEPLPKPYGSLATNLSVLRVCIHSRCPVARLHNASPNSSAVEQKVLGKCVCRAEQSKQPKERIVRQEVKHTTLQMTPKRHFAIVEKETVGNSQPKRCSLLTNNVCLNKKLYLVDNGNFKVRQRRQCGLYLKATNQMVFPTSGFTVVESHMDDGKCLYCPHKSPQSNRTCSSQPRANVQHGLHNGITAGGYNSLSSPPTSMSVIELLCPNRLSVADAKPRPLHARYPHRPRSRPPDNQLPPTPPSLTDGGGYQPPPSVSPGYGSG